MNDEQQRQIEKHDRELRDLARRAKTLAAAREIIEEYHWVRDDCNDPPTEHPQVGEAIRVIDKIRARIDKQYHAAIDAAAAYNESIGRDIYQEMLGRFAKPTEGGDEE